MDFDQADAVNISLRSLSENSCQIEILQPISYQRSLTLFLIKIQIAIFS